MKRCLIWGIGDDYYQCHNQVLFEELKGNLIIDAMISRDKFSDYNNGKKVIDKTEIAKYVFDYIIIFNYTNFSRIKDEAVDLGVPKDKIINGRFF